MNETRKWILHRISAIVLAPLYVWLYFSLISLSTKNYSEAIYFFKNPLFAIVEINRQKTTHRVRLLDPFLMLQNPNPSSLKPLQDT